MRTPFFIPTLGAFGLAALLLAAPPPLPAGQTDDAPAMPRRLRQPVALAIVDGGRTLLAATRKSGSLSVIDTATRRVVAEHDLGAGLADLAVLPDGRHLLAVDRVRNELLLIEHHDRSSRLVDRVAGRWGKRDRAHGVGLSIACTLDNG